MFTLFSIQPTNFPKQAIALGNFLSATQTQKSDRNIFMIQQRRGLYFIAMNDVKSIDPQTLSAHRELGYSAVDSFMDRTFYVIPSCIIFFKKSNYHPTHFTKYLQMCPASSYPYNDHSDTHAHRT